jgi:hypothetical protein
MTTTATTAATASTAATTATTTATTAMTATAPPNKKAKCMPTSGPLIHTKSLESHEVLRLYATHPGPIGCCLEETPLADNPQLVESLKIAVASRDHNSNSYDSLFAVVDELQTFCLVRKILPGSAAEQWGLRVCDILCPEDPEGAKQGSPWKNSNNYKQVLEFLKHPQGNLHLYVVRQKSQEGRGAASQTASTTHATQHKIPGRITIEASPISGLSTAVIKSSSALQTQHLIHQLAGHLQDKKIMHPNISSWDRQVVRIVACLRQFATLLCDGVANRDAARRAGASKMLMNCLDNEFPDKVRIGGMVAIACLTHANEQNALCIMNAGGGQKIWDVLLSGSPKLCNAAMSALLSLSHFASNKIDGYRFSVKSMNYFLEKHAHALSSPENREILLKSCRLLGVLGGSPQGNKSIAKEGGVVAVAKIIEKYPDDTGIHEAAQYAMRRLLD